MSTDTSLSSAAAERAETHLVIPSDPVREQLSALAAELHARRDHILNAWRAAGEVTGQRDISTSLSRVQFNDHIPAVLDCFSHTLQAWPRPHNAMDDQLETETVCEHGLQRWQQGYQLRELVREWGFLQISVADELERYASDHPDLDPSVMPAARRAWTQLCAAGVTESATQYWLLHQNESAGHVRDLEHALATLHAMERSRAEGWRNAAHDLRGSVTAVKGATNLLHDDALPLSAPDRAEVADILDRSVASLSDMLNDLLSLARLEAGHEQRVLSTFDAATALREFCLGWQSAATDRGLFLKMDGPSSLRVTGDKAKVMRILQNLLINAVKYTHEGGVAVTWGVDEGRDMDRWTFSVQDTGPGVDGTDSGPLAQALLAATGVADDARAASTDRRQDMPAAATLRSVAGSGDESPPGEGVGLTIVKRLCELLDATLELATAAGRGTTFRVVLPRTYAEAPE